MSKSNNIDPKTDAKMRELLALDPVPELDNFEIETMVQRVLGRVEVGAKTRPWYRLWPAWSAGLAAVAALLLLITLTGPPQAVQRDIDLAELTEYSEEIAPEELLAEAIVDGSIDEEAALGELLSIDTGSAQDVYSSFITEDLDASIDMLTDEQAVDIMELMDELGYPGIEEV